MIVAATSSFPKALGEILLLEVEKQFQTVMLGRSMPTFLIYVCVLLVGSDVE
jgi:hypothetical protein